MGYKKKKNEEGKEDITKGVCKALDKLAAGKADPEVQQSAREFSRWLLSQPAKTKEGSIISMQGRNLSIMDTTILSMVQGNNATPTSQMTVLTLAGVLDSSHEINEEERKRKAAARARHKRAIEREKRNSIARLKKAGIYNVALMPLIDSCANLHVTADEMHDGLVDPYTGELEFEIETTSREGSKRVYSRGAVARLADLQKRMFDADEELLKTALKLQSFYDDDNETSDDKISNYINSLLKDR